MAYIQTKAVVLKVMDYGESDKIVTFFTQDHGKLKGIAKGAKRSKKRFVNKLEFFTLLEITAVPGRRSNLYLIDQANLINPFPSLHESYQRYTGAMLVCELMDKWTRENDSDHELFGLLIWALDALCSSHQLIDILIFFHIKMLAVLGLGLQLDHCLACQEDGLKDVSYWFSPALNGIVCNKCRQQKDLGQITLSTTAIKTLQMALSLPLEKLTRLKISKTAQKETAKVLQLYCQFQLQRDINSWKHFDFTK